MDDSVAQPILAVQLLPYSTQNRKGKIAFVPWALSRGRYKVQIKKLP
jgi:hypothetical protein